MKRVWLRLMFLSILFVFVACKQEKEEAKEEAYFHAIILEIQEQSILVQPLEGEEELQSADLISVSKNVKSEEEVPDLKIGDQVKVVYDGRIAESYPAQIHQVYGIYRIDQQTEISNQVQYIRTNGYHDWLEYPYLVTVNSVNDLKEYYSNYQGVFDLGARNDENGRGWINAVGNYDEEWFLKSQLLMIILEEGSGSIHHKVTGINENNNTRFVMIDREVPDIGTDDMAEWHILMEADKNDTFDGVQIDDTINLKDKTVYTVEEMKQLLESIIINLARTHLSQEEKETVTNIETPIIEIMSYKTMKTLNLYYFLEEYNPGYEETPIWKVTFNTTADALLGPIVFYIDSSGNKIAADWRE